MSGEDSNLVDAIMNEMERNNGSYNEEQGKFTGGPVSMSQHGHQNQLTPLQEEFLQLIHENRDLAEMIARDPVNREKINQILSHGEFLHNLMENRSMVPTVIRDCLQEQPDPSPVKKYPINNVDKNAYSNETSMEHSDYDDDKDASVGIGVGVGHEIEHSPLTKLSHVTTRPNAGSLDGEEGDGSSLTDFIIGPVLAAVAFFLVTNTPLLYYIGQIPYLGSYMVGNKLITSLVLVMAIFIVGSLLIDIIGLI